MRSKATGRAVARASTLPCRVPCTPDWSGTIATSTELPELHGLHLSLGFPGSGSDPLQEALGPALRAAGARVTCRSLDPALADEELERRWLADLAGPGLVLGGFSLGARLAVTLAQTVRPLALLLFGYPVHPRGEPKNRPGLELLRGLDLPTLLVQGSRDAHGSRTELAGCGPLPACLRIHWLEDGNHRFVPRARSDETELGHLRAAASASLAFLRDQLEAPRG